MGCGKDKAGELIGELRCRGLIPSKEAEQAMLAEQNTDGADRQAGDEEEQE